MASVALIAHEDQATVDRAIWVNALGSPDNHCRFNLLLADDIRAIESPPLLVQSVGSRSPKSTSRFSIDERWVASSLGPWRLKFVSSFSSISTFVFECHRLYSTRESKLITAEHLLLREGSPKWRDPKITVSRYTLAPVTTNDVRRNSYLGLGFDYPLSSTCLYFPKDSSFLSSPTV